MQIVFTIPDEKVSRVLAAVVGLFPVPTDKDNVPLFTDAQWAKERLKRFIIDLVFQYERREAEALVEKDEGLVS